MGTRDPVAHHFPLFTARQLEIPHKHLARVCRAAFVVAVSWVALALLQAVSIAIRIAVITVDGILAVLRRFEVAPELEPVVLSIANPVIIAIMVACVVARIEDVEHKWPPPALRL